jgi:hypothetical protein
VGAEAPVLVGADAPRPARQASPEALAGEGSSDRPVAEGSPRQVGYDSPPQVGYDSPELAGDDAAGRQMPPTDPDERQPLIRWRLERPMQGWRGGDQRSAFSRWAEDRHSLLEHDADGVEDASEMERQVRDQLYGPGFRRR